MRILKVIARLLDYPTQEVLDNTESLKQATEDCQYLSPSSKQSILDLINVWSQTNLYELQEQYDNVFERGRHVSLLLFEHVHGESRDRGQAMVDLLDVYRQNGFELDSRQMPDYIPLFLEFLSEQREPTAREWLADVSHILALLEERLEQRGNMGSALFTSLIALSNVRVNREQIKQQVDKEPFDDSLEAIDREWEEKEVRFDEPIGNSCPASGPNGAGCSAAAHSGRQTEHEIPLNWHQRFTDKSLQR
jgi:nitrate reductase delta subunit